MKFKNFSIMTAKLRLLLKLLNEGASQREISRQLDISRTSVKSYMDRFTASGMSNTELQSLDDGALLKISQGEIYRQQGSETSENDCTETMGRIRRGVWRPGLFLYNIQASSSGIHIISYL